MEEVLKTLLEAVREANHELGGYFDYLAPDINNQLEELGLQPLQVEEK